MPPRPKKPAKRRISPQVSRAIDALIDGRARNQVQAAKLGGCTREALNRALGDPDVNAEIKRRIGRNVDSVWLINAAKRFGRLINKSTDAVGESVSRAVLEHNGVLRGRAGSLPTRLPGAGPAVTIVFQHVQPIAAAQNGAPAVHSGAVIEQRAEVVDDSSAARVLAKVVCGPGEGIETPGGRDA